MTDRRTPQSETLAQAAQRHAERIIAQREALAELDKLPKVPLSQITAMAAEAPELVAWLRQVAEVHKRARATVEG